MFAMKKKILAAVTASAAVIMCYAILPPFIQFAAPAITAVYDIKSKTVIIKWIQKDNTAKTFIVQRSNNNTVWTDIARLEIIQVNAYKAWQYADSYSGGGDNYYRLAAVIADGKTEYSAVVMVLKNGFTNWIMYPVPVTDLLTLQYKGTEKITGVINITIQTIQGYVFTRLRCASNTTAVKIPVSNLGRGVYDIRIVIDNSTVWNQRFVK
jgi:hypothetical protein